MTHSIINSETEFALRALLTLYMCDEARSLDDIVMLDFITSYAADFGIGESNLHGINENKESEYSARRVRTQEAISFLVTYGLVDVEEDTAGFRYRINDEGAALCDHMTTPFAADYMITAVKADEYMRRHTFTDVLNQINRRARIAL